MKYLIVVFFLVSLPALMNTAFCQQFTRSPLEAVMKIADRTIAHAAFELKGTVAKPQSAFRMPEVINFGRSFNAETGTAYAWSVLDWKRNDSAAFKLSFDGKITIWVNGLVAYENNDAAAESRVLELEREWKMPVRIHIPLKRGQNEILIKSSKTGQGRWRVMLQPEGLQKEEGDVTISEAPLSFAIAGNRKVSPELASLTNWLLLGPFREELPGEEASIVADGFCPGKLYNVQSSPTSWTLPKAELVTDVFGADPLWGSLYDWNYHTAGVAWAIGKLGDYTQNGKYVQYNERYCQFMAGIKPYVAFEKYGLDRLSSRFSRMVDSPLLDFSVAPVLPFVSDAARKRGNGQSPHKSLIDHTVRYLSDVQLRYTDGTFARETPRVYTIWVDDMFMGIPFLLEASRLAPVTEGAKLLDEAAEQVIRFHRHLYDPRVNLYHHAWFSEKPDTKLPYWSRANGWAIWAVSEVLLYLPDTHPRRKEMLAIYRNHIDGLVRCQNPSTGVYPNLLDEPGSFAETSGTAIFTMAIARGINKGWLSRKKYEGYAVKGWYGLDSFITPEGEVRGICMGTMCSEERDYYRNRPVVTNDSHGLLGLIVAGIEMDRLLKAKSSIR